MPPLTQPPEKVVLNISILLIEQVVVVYNALNEFADSKKKKSNIGFIFQKLFILPLVAKHQKVIFFGNRFLT